MPEPFDYPEEDNVTVLTLRGSVIMALLIACLRLHVNRRKHPQLHGRVRPHKA